jgi:hypothetical protein
MRHAREIEYAGANQACRGRQSSFARLLRRFAPGNDGRLQKATPEG